MIAVQKGLSEDSAAQEEGAAYLHSEARRQIEAGAHYLDLNVDETSTLLDVQIAAIRWLVGIVQEISPIPLSIDSSKTAILREGLNAYDRRAGRPMLTPRRSNGSTRWILAREFDAEVVAGASGIGTIPKDADERLERRATACSMPKASREHIHVDPLVVPFRPTAPMAGTISTPCVPFAQSMDRPSIAHQGGLSNVSFGMPNRKLVNEAFILLAVEAGIDGAIIDPVQSTLADVLAQDQTAEPFVLARAILTTVRINLCSSTWKKDLRAGKLNAK